MPHASRDGGRSSTPTRNIVAPVDAVKDQECRRGYCPPGTTKPLSEFYRQRSGQPFAWCKTCHTKRGRENRIKGVKRRISRLPEAKACVDCKVTFPFAAFRGRDPRQGVRVFAQCPACRSRAKTEHMAKCAHAPKPVSPLDYADHVLGVLALRDQVALAKALQHASDFLYSVPFHKLTDEERANCVPHARDALKANPMKFQ